MRIFLTLAPALVAACLGVFAQTAQTSAGYVTALRVMFLGTLALTWIAVLIHVGRQHASTFQRVLLALFLLGVLRVMYVPLLELGLLGAAWTGRLGAFIGMEDRGLLVHAAFGFWMAIYAGPLCMGLVAAITRRVAWPGAIALVLLALFAVAAFLAPADRTPLPQDVATFSAPERTRPLAEPGPEAARAPFRQVLVRRGERFATRVVALGGVLIEFTLPRAGWGGTVRTALGERCARAAPQSWTAFVTDLEYAFVEARPLLVDEP